MSDHVTYLSGEDAREFRRVMAFTDITHKLVAEMARASDPEIWQADDIIDRLRSLKRAKSALKALGPEQLDIRQLAGEPVSAIRTRAPGNDQSFGGIKVETESGWFAARPSGTEDVYKIYAESFRDQNHLKAIQQDAQRAIAKAF
jgi:phosphoglucomutase